MTGDLHLFEGFGVELEYMMVDANTLDVRPITDEAIRRVAGEITSEIEMGPLAWSNELVLHVIELKTNGPAPTLTGLAATFHRDVVRINEIVASLGARLMPSAAHPWMDPARETRLWPHEYNPVYESFDRIFGCRGHGWSNLQSVHVNLPFNGDDEFGRLHAAIRMVLPIIPAISAASPFLDGMATGLMDSRLNVYRNNAKRIPSIAGRIVPEPVFTREDYEREILSRIYRDLEPHDPEGILQYEWANARGAIARFDRSAIEIRTIDIQECPACDLAVVHAVAQVVAAHTEERWIDSDAQRAWDTERLNRILERTTAEAERAVIDDPEYLRAFGMQNSSCSAAQLWRHLADTVVATGPISGFDAAPLEVILRGGPLARRVSTAAGPEPSRDRLASVYGALCDCLASGKPYVPS